MAPNNRSVRLFTLGSSITGNPSLIEPALFSVLGAKELQDIERWIKKTPELLGEEIRIVASQLANWDKTKDRPDLIGIDRNGKLVVVEIKRDSSGSGQDLQAIRYAAYASTLTSDEVVELYRTYRKEEHKEALSAAEAREALEGFILAGDLDELDEDDSPRIVLVAAAFLAGVTSTALWLRNSFGMDLSCVRIEPYELQGELVLSSTTLIPLPEAEDYEVKVQAKKRKASSNKGAPINFEAVKAFISSIPEGRWSSYGDVAASAGSPKGGQAVGTWLMKTKDDIPTVYRVLNRHGEVSEGFTADDPKLPPTPDAVRKKLIAEGVIFDDLRASQEQRWAPEDWASEEAS
jgi:alkylated DNA nucleotide flippase Atl1